MTEGLLKGIAYISRNTFHFKGKYRICKLIEKTLNPKKKWKNPTFYISLKDNRKMFIDVRSHTHSVAFWCGKYDNEILNKFCSLFKENWTVLDIGANIGYYSIGFGQRLKTLNGTVLSFEPVDSNYSSLLKNIEANDLKEYVHPLNFGLGEKNDTYEISITEAGSSSNAFVVDGSFNSKNEKRTQKIEMKKLDDFESIKKLNRCDFIKIDVEGYEVFFLRGAKEFIKKHQPIIYGEFNSFFIPQYGVSMTEVLDFFSALNYHIYEQKITSTRTTKFTTLDLNKKNPCDLLLIPKSISDKERIKWIS